MPFRTGDGKKRMLRMIEDYKSAKRNANGCTSGWGGCPQTAFEEIGLAMIAKDGLIVLW
jgi:hypothetical protein